MTDRIYLSPPHMSDSEISFVQQAMAEIEHTPIDQYTTSFEQAFQEYVGAKHAVAVSSGTAAIHLALMAHGIQRDDTVLVSTLTFVASVNPILYVGAHPVFIDSDPQSWNLDPNLLEDTLKMRARRGQVPKALVVVHLYGQSADMNVIMSICDRYGVTVIEDAAEALGSRYHDRHPGTLGHAGAFSFNGNKIVTTSAGGMLVADDPSVIDYARQLAYQLTEPFQHNTASEIGYDYGMNGVLAAIGYGQLLTIEERVQQRRHVFDFYRKQLGDLPGLQFVKEMPYGRHSRWLSVILVDAAEFGATPEQIRLKLEEHNIEARPLWKPMHCQPVFKDYEAVGGEVAESLFKRGLCLPSGTTLTSSQLDYIVSIVRDMHRT